MNQNMLNMGYLCSDIAKIFYSDKIYHGYHHCIVCEDICEQFTRNEIYMRYHGAKWTFI